MQKIIEVKTQATYETLGELTPKTEAVWLVCHGYGQLAKHFIRRFDILNPVKNYVIAPQGLSKFYVKPYTKVGASWLTKEDRLLDLENQLNYVQSVFLKETKDIDWSKTTLHIMGFSQGTATISRWVTRFKIPFDQIILWGGMLANELETKDFQFAKPTAEIWGVIGNNDEFYNEKAYQAHLEYIQSVYKKPKTLIFEGKHEVTRTALAAITARHLLHQSASVEQ